MRRFLSIILAVMMLALPVLGMAATPTELMTKALAGNRAVETTLSFEPGTLPGDNDVTTAIKDLLSGLSIHAVAASGGNYSKSELMMNGKVFLTFEASVADGTVALRNELLGTAPLTLSKGDVRPFMERITKAFGGEQPVDSSELHQVVEAVETALGAAPMAVDPVAMETKAESLLQSLAATFENGESVDAIDTAGEFSPVATGKKVTLTAALMKEFYTKLLGAAGMNETVENAVNSNVDTFFSVVSEGTATMYYNGENVPTLLDLSVALKEEATKDAGPLRDVTNVTMKVGQADVDGVASTKTHLMLTSKKYADESFEGMLVYTPTETKTTLQGRLAYKSPKETKEILTLHVTKDKAYGDMEAANTYQGTLELMGVGDPESKHSVTFQGDSKTTFDGKDAAFEGQATISIPTLGVEGLKIKSAGKTVDVPTMELSGARDLGKMMEEELTQFVSTLQMSVMGTVGNIIQAMPASVTKLLMPPAAAE